MKVGAKTPSIESIRLLHTLCQTENLADAAERLGLSLPTASRMLSQLREVYEDRLFTRFPGGLVPTRKAKLLMTRTEAVLETYDALLAPQTFDPARIVRDIRIGCADNAPFSVFPNFARELLAQAPGVMISYLPLSDDRFSLLSSGEIDFAVSPVMTLPPRISCDRARRYGLRPHRKKRSSAGAQSSEERRFHCRCPQARLCRCLLSPSSGGILDVAPRKRFPGMD